MASATINKLQDKTGTQFFPITHVDAVIDENGDSASVLLGQKQNTLVSGTNIKTINNQSVLGSGNLVVSGEDQRIILIEEDMFAVVDENLNIGAYLDAYGIHAKAFLNVNL